MERKFRPIIDALPAHVIKEQLLSWGYSVGATPKTDTNPTRHVHFIKREDDLEFHWVFRRINERLKPNNFYVAIESGTQSKALEAKKDEVLRLIAEIKTSMTCDDSRALIGNLESALYFSSPIKVKQKQGIVSGSHPKRTQRLLRRESKRRQDRKLSAEVDE